MTRFLLGPLLAVAVLVAQAPEQQAPVFRVTGDTVPVFVTVTDKDNRLVPGLTRDQFQVFDNGRPQTLTVFDATPQPIHLIVMLDVSGSMEGNLGLLRAACLQLFQRLRPDDMAKVGMFGREIIISPEFTHDAGQLRAALPVEMNPTAPTPLWHALNQAMDGFAKVDGRRVMLVLSDGKDTGPMSFRERMVIEPDIVDRARRDEVMVYGIGMRSRGPMAPMPAPGQAGLMHALTADEPDPGLSRAATDTGGGYLKIRPRDDLTPAFTRVADELHSQYLLGFTPQVRDGKSHKIEVKVTAKDVQPRARKTYQAPKK